MVEKLSSVEISERKLEMSRQMDRRPTGRIPITGLRCDQKTTDSWQWQLGALQKKEEHLIHKQLWLNSARPYTHVVWNSLSFVGFNVAHSTTSRSLVPSKWYKDTSITHGLYVLMKIPGLDYVANKKFDRTLHPKAVKRASTICTSPALPPHLNNAYFPIEVHPILVLSTALSLPFGLAPRGSVRPPEFENTISEIDIASTDTHTECGVTYSVFGERPINGEVERTEREKVPIARILGTNAVGSRNAAWTVKIQGTLKYNAN
ncbi:hypothetical protein K438DRAFT_1764869 [Mycena galopus ATCC 62051]|nr:hypothetical protein K438DRAFT_1764869 [Mycena galopus ATCC 62051]